MSKKELYEELIKHMHHAVEEGFFLEASWLSYAIIEDRTKRILEVSVVPRRRRESLADKTKKLRELAARSGVLAVYLNDDVAPKKEDGDALPLALLDELDPWRDDRNRLVHRVADGTIDYEDAAEQVAKLGRDGAKLAAKFAKIGRQVKKHMKRMEKRKSEEAVISA